MCNVNISRIPIRSDLSETQLALKEAIRLAQVKSNEAHNVLWRLIGTCQHAYLNMDDSAVCAICGDTAGWWCPESPDGRCDYAQDDGSYDPDQCRYCGQPGERT